MKTKILTDFQICISVPLTLKKDFIKIFCQYKKKKLILMSVKIFFFHKQSILRQFIQINCNNDPFTYSELTIATLEQGVKYVQS